MYQCIFIHILCRRGCNLMDIFFRCDRSIRSTSIIFEFLFVLLEHKIFLHINNGTYAHSYLNNFNYHLERKKETFLAILYRRHHSKNGKKIRCVWILEYILSVRTFFLQELFLFEILNSSKNWWVLSFFLNSGALFQIRIIIIFD